MENQSCSHSRKRFNLINWAWHKLNNRINEGWNIRIFIDLLCLVCSKDSQPFISDITYTTVQFQMYFKIDFSWVDIVIIKGDRVILDLSVLVGLVKPQFILPPWVALQSIQNMSPWRLFWWYKISDSHKLVVLFGYFLDYPSLIIIWKISIFSSPQYKYGYVVFIFTKP